MPASSRKGKSRAAEPAPTATIPLGKQLAHTDKSVRDRAVQSLVAFLSRGGDAEGSSSGYVRLEESEMSKLWKGLFYCFWMSDKPLVQQALATDLAELLLQIHPSVEVEHDKERFKAAVAFLDGFWRAIVREMDKFYLLIRRYVNATFRLLARADYEDPKVPISLGMHLADIYVEELDKVLRQPEVDAAPSCPLVEVLRPHITLLARTPHQVMHNRLMTALFTPLLDALALASSAEERPRKRAKVDEPMYAHVIMHSTTSEGDSPEAIRLAVLKAMFEAAAAERAVESNRRKIYKVWREEGDDE
ncbi:hypothetical protein EHS25_007690 [Saitozyma podzolica]|uniref:Ribosomal RNA-processing protein 1 n=1 Tax=Saitozyma podzolica TaxID=1890683 RepID=A0A427YQM5_9TREE|nr:hypothetical protein EHS25_007690 [Saitozyma podzolica]